MENISYETLEKIGYEGYVLPGEGRPRFTPNAAI